MSGPAALHTGSQGLPRERRLARHPMVHRAEGR